MIKEFIPNLASDPLILSRISLLVSFVTPFFIALNYFRDRATAKAFSVIIQSEGYTDDGKDSINSYYLKIKIVNTGRRPLQLTHFVVRFPRHSGSGGMKYILNEKGFEIQKSELDDQFSDLMNKATFNDSGNEISVKNLDLDEEAEHIIQEHSALMVERIKNFREWCLVGQNYALLLNEGQALERVFMLNDQDEKYFYFVDSISGEIAIDLFIEDASGMRYKVKDFRKNLQKLF